jgi:opacity protein-like surface antigen
MKQIKRRLMQAAIASTLGGTLAGASLMADARPANAQAAYGSYVGIGAAFGITEEADTGRGDGFSGVITGRYRFLRMPVSLRATAFVFGGSFAIVPTVSYDYPLNWNTDIYLGAGVSFPTGSDDDVSPVGNQTAFVLQPGIDYMFPNSRLGLFGNAIIAFGGYREGGNTAVSLQGGVGYQF